MILKNSSTQAYLFNGQSIYNDLIADVDIIDGNLDANNIEAVILGNKLVGNGEINMLNKEINLDVKLALNNKILPNLSFKIEGPLHNPEKKISNDLIEDMIKNLVTKNTLINLEKEKGLKFKNILDGFLEDADVTIKKEKIENNFDDLLEDLLGN